MNCKSFDWPEGGWSGHCKHIVLGQRMRLLYPAQTNSAPVCINAVNFNDISQDLRTIPMFKLQSKFVRQLRQFRFICKNCSFQSQSAEYSYSSIRIPTHPLFNSECSWTCVCTLIYLQPQTQYCENRFRNTWGIRTGINLDHICKLGWQRFRTNCSLIFMETWISPSWKTRASHSNEM